MSREETKALDRMLAALTAPAHPGELEGRDRALAAFREAAAGPSPVAPESLARKGLRAGRLPLRLGVAALCATLLGGGVAVATGAGLPLPGRQDAPRPAPAEKGPGLTPKKAPSAAPATGGPAARPAPSGPPASSFAALCRWILREDEGRHRRPDPAGGRGEAYAALVRAAGGPDEVYGYCLAMAARDPGPPGRPDGGRDRGDRRDGGHRDDRSDRDDHDHRDDRDHRDGGPDRPGRPGRR
ncbi:hypothetical protein [Actinocorallia populi]|uniref:hypothetical protein n=1 Tax=Actinocorallia populi TaxID=2079200 RepID=UPI000D091BFC|nr:hypothetical protein [Actinocorallia populi]